MTRLILVAYFFHTKFLTTKSEKIKTIHVGENSRLYRDLIQPVASGHISYEFMNALIHITFFSRIFDTRFRSKANGFHTNG